MYKRLDRLEITSRWYYLSCRVDTVHVDSVDESDRGRLFWVVVAAFWEGFNFNLRHKKMWKVWCPVSMIIGWKLIWSKSNQVGLTEPEWVHPVFKGSPRWPYDHPCPVLQVDVIFVLKTPAEQEKVDDLIKEGCTWSHHLHTLPTITNTSILIESWYHMICRTNLMVPSPTPFWPASSSSSRRKLRGITVDGRVSKPLNRSIYISHLVPA